MSLPILSCTCIMWSGSLKVQSYPFSLALSHVSGLKRRIRLVLSQSRLDLCVESCWGWRSLYSFGVLLISLVWGSSILILDLWWLILYSEVRLNLIPIICFAAIFPRAGFISIMSKTNPSGSLVDENFWKFWDVWYTTSTRGFWRSLYFIGVSWMVRNPLLCFILIHR